MLIRHAAHAEIGSRLCGRRHDVGLDCAGRCQAERLARGLADERLTAIYSSPARRTRQTAECIASATGCVVRVAPELEEIDFGDWDGRSFGDLAGQAEWILWNSRRSAARCPGGESMIEVQRRALVEVRRAARHHPDERIAIVTHGDVIRSVIAKLIGLPLDRMLRLSADPASVSRIAFEGRAGRLAALNELPA